MVKKLTERFERIEENGEEHMHKAIQNLLENNVINEAMRVEIQEAWDSHLNEAREEIRAELREEFAQRFEHDKSVMVEALDKMVTEGLASEIADFARDKKALVEARVQQQKKMNETATRFSGFMSEKLAHEIKELREDRERQKIKIENLESFVTARLAKEIREFAEDKRDLAATKVRLVKEADQKLKELKQRFLKESAAKVKDHVSAKLTSELTSLNEDIRIARENSFGRRVFEAFASEFSGTLLNENAEIKKLQKLLNDKETQLAEAKASVAKARTLVESKERQLARLADSSARQELLTELMGPLDANKRQVMGKLLENVQTSRLAATFEKYLPAVLNETSERGPKAKQPLNEQCRVVTGNKSAKPSTGEDDLVDIKKLAGL